MLDLSKNEKKADRGEGRQYPASIIRLQRGEHLFCFLYVGPHCLGFLRQSIAFAGGNIDLCLFNVDLSGPRLQFLLFLLDFVVENLGLI